MAVVSFSMFYPFHISYFMNFHSANFRSKHGTIARNADFQASDQSFKIYDIDGVSTIAQCATQCMADGICLTALYVKLQQRCFLFSELSSMGTITPSSVDSSVISFGIAGKINQIKERKFFYVIPLIMNRIYYL